MKTIFDNCGIPVFALERSQSPYRNVESSEKRIFLIQLWLVWVNLSLTIDLHYIALIFSLRLSGFRRKAHFLLNAANASRALEKNSLFIKRSQCLSGSRKRPPFIKRRQSPYRNEDQKHLLILKILSETLFPVCSGLYVAAYSYKRFNESCL
jgi:hypothetical protein